MITTPPSPARLRQGDVGYTSIWLPDVDRAAAFYGAVLGWHTTSGSVASARRVEGLPEQHIGMFGGQEHRTAFLAFAVEDVHDAVRRIRDAGGQAEGPTDEPYGLAAMCTDDQGMGFTVYQRHHRGMHRRPGNPLLPGPALSHRTAATSASPYSR